MIGRKNLFVALTPEYLFKIPIKTSLIILIDIFRATTTITAALNAGVPKLLPVSSLEEARNSRTPDVLLGGEHKAAKPYDFDLGNSPLEYTPDKIGNKTVVFYTTNGTRVLALVKEAPQIIFGSFWNISAIEDYVKKWNGDVALVCAGWRSHVALEDAVFAGAMVKRLEQNFSPYADDPVIAKMLWEQGKDNLHEFLRRGTHWKRLRRQGVEQDFEVCLRQDVTDVIPIYKDPYIVPLKIKTPSHAFATANNHHDSS
ncbi:MAG: 2-phosphosulfolactate phosphatase [Chlorobi bacterium]|nr:2-phosphosulfolactate phosphatase [Chlorobiota bacterium]